MSKLWINNDLGDRIYMLNKATEAHNGMMKVAVEKDWWVMVTLQALFHCGCRDSLLFKGGTSLSKGFGVINRFSEAIVEHRRTYYTLKYVDYDLHARKNISFLPPEEQLDNWREDYTNMQNYFIYTKALSFDALMERMKDLQKRVNEC